MKSLKKKKQAVEEKIVPSKPIYFIPFYNYNFKNMYYLHYLLCVIMNINARLTLIILFFFSYYMIKY